VPKHGGRLVVVAVVPLGYRCGFVAFRTLGYDEYLHAYNDVVQQSKQYVCVCVCVLCVCVCAVCVCVCVCVALRVCVSSVFSSLPFPFHLCCSQRRYAICSAAGLQRRLECKY